MICGPKITIVASNRHAKSIMTDAHPKTIKPGIDSFFKKSFVCESSFMFISQSLSLRILQTMEIFYNTSGYGVSDICNCISSKKLRYVTDSNPYIKTIQATCRYVRFTFKQT